ncbi:DUF1742-domain-containing protein [Xylariaceae sp. FL0016]|nr:DUF1742-domain-containing protein [Xylariaceae sp. FL0016]
MSIPNVWHHRKVADTSAKGCELCYKPTTSVLVTPEKQDFFYVCPGHLKDSKFCSPIIDHEAVAARKKKEADEEVERVRKEYEEKQRKKKEKESEKDTAKKDDKDQDDKEDTKMSAQNEESKKAEKQPSDTTQPKVEEEARIFSLQRTFHQQRVDRKRQAEVAKRNRERMSNPSFFPSVPKGQP